MKERLSDEDRERNEDTELISGSVGGATGAGVGAGLGMAALGPAGAVLGALAGAAGGWWAGQGAQQAVEDVDRADNRFRRAHEHGGASRPYDEIRHAYQLGYLAGRNPDYAERGFAGAEEDLRTAWVQAHLRDPAAVEWEEVRGAARAGYDLAHEAEPS